MSILKGLVQYYKTDKKDFIYSCLFLTILAIFLYYGLLLASIVDN